MPKVFAVCNRKGGVGKSTVTAGLADALGQAGKRALVVDLDPQANLTAALGVESAPFTINDVLFGDPKTREVNPGVILEAFVPAGDGWHGVDVIAAEDELAGREQDQMVGRETRLRTAMEGALATWDVVLIDCPPSLGQLTINALVAADQALLITEPRSGSVEGLAKIVTTMASVQRHFNADLALAGVIVNKYASTRRDRSLWLSSIEANYGSKVLTPYIPERETIPSASSDATPLSAYGAKTREVTEIFAALAGQLT